MRDVGTVTARTYWGVPFRMTGNVTAIRGSRDIGLS